MTLGYAVLQDAFQQLSNIEGRGLLGDLDSDVVEGVKQEEDDDYDQLAAGDGRPSSSESIDFVDIDEVAEDQEEAEAQRRLQERRLQERRLQQEYYAKGLVFTHGACLCLCVCVLSFVCVCLSMCSMCMWSVGIFSVLPTHLHTAPPLTRRSCHLTGGGGRGL